MENVEKLKQIIAESAKKYKPKNEANWVSYYDTAGYVETFEDMNDSTFCEDCIGAAIETAKGMEKPEDFAEFTYQTETSVEKDFPLICDTCGEVIFCTVLWDGQEMEHWLELDTFDVNCTQTCYELMTLLEDKPEGYEQVAANILELIENDSSK